MQWGRWNGPKGLIVETDDIIVTLPESNLQLHIEYARAH